MGYRIGLHQPSDVGALVVSLSGYNPETEMCWTVYESTDEFSYLLETWHDAVGLVTWYRFEDAAAIAEEVSELEEW